jgi:hypothetical protein
MYFPGKYPVRSKICIYDKIIEQVICFKYLEYYVTYKNEKDIAAKSTNFYSAMGVINQVFKPNLIRIHPRIRVYKILATPVVT